MNTPKVLAFDLDDTLAPSKYPMTHEMGRIMGCILESYDVCVISGGSFIQFKTQLLDSLPEKADVSRLHLMPTCGAQYYRYDHGWKQVYSEDIKKSDKAMITNVLNAALDTLGLREKETYGEIIEDRDTQITLSVLGQDIVRELGFAGVERKRAWDMDGSKKERLRKYISAHIPNYETRVGGTTSIDVTRPGVDKAYGIRKLTEILDINPSDIVFYGDRLEKGGNDYPVLATGVRGVAVTGWQDTLAKLKEYI